MKRWRSHRSCSTPQLLARERIERAERLIEQQQRRLVDQRAAQRRALLHAARQLPGIMFREAVEPDHGQQVARLGDIFLAVLLESARVRLDDLKRQQHVVERSAPRQQGRVLERHADDLERRRDLVIGNDDAALGWPVEPSDELEQRRFAAAGRADHGDELALLHAQARILERERLPLAPRIGEIDVGNIDERGHAVGLFARRRDADECSVSCNAISLPRNAISRRGLPPSSREAAGRVARRSERSEQRRAGWGERRPLKCKIPPAPDPLPTASRGEGRREAGASRITKPRHLCSYSTLPAKAACGLRQLADRSVGQKLGGEHVAGRRDRRQRECLADGRDGTGKPRVAHAADAGPPSIPR